MTIKKLHKILTEAISKGHGRKKVFCDKPTFKHRLEPDGVTILPVMLAELRTINMANDYGGIKERKDGTESLSTCMILCGEHESEE